MRPAKPLYYACSVEIQAPPDTVWSLLTDPAFTPLYMFHCVPETDWQPGSTLLWKGKLDGTVHVQGQVLRFEPPVLLSFTAFDPQGPYEDIPANYLTTTYTLKKTRTGTLLTVAQGDFNRVENGMHRFASAEGWQEVLAAIRDLAEEAGDTMPKANTDH